MFEAGKRIGSYEIVSELRSGGMATLYLARRAGVAGFAKHVAIKVVHPHLAKDESFAQMFVDEALLAVRVVHPNIVHVEELGQIDGTYFLAMEYVRGCSLARLRGALRKQKRRMSPDLAVWIATKVAEGLHSAHETRRDEDGELLGVVHRDVSPQNILLAYQGHVKLIDFGIAKARGRAQETEAGSIKGKLRYMSPEQAFGKPVDRRADIYSLGVVLWEVLTGRKLFNAPNDLALLDQVRHPNVVPPGDVVEGIPPALDDAIMTALSPEAEDRPASAQAFRRLLADAVPDALKMDGTDMAELLSAVMADQIAKEREALPESVTSLSIEVMAFDEQGQVITRYTTDTEGPTRPSQLGDGPDSESNADTPTSSRREPPPLPPSSRSAPASLSATANPTEELEPPRSSRLRNALVIAAAAAVTIGIGIYVITPSTDAAVVEVSDGAAALEGDPEPSEAAGGAAPAAPTSAPDTPAPSADATASATAKAKAPRRRIARKPRPATKPAADSKQPAKPPAQQPAATPLIVDDIGF